MSRHPGVKWAQRSDRLYITVELPDAQDVKLKLEPEGKFFFSATSRPDKVPYDIDIDLYDKVNVEESKSSISSRNICYLVKKAEDKWWSRLLKQAGKPPVFLKVDWEKWVDEDGDEQENQDDMDVGDVDFSKLNMGGDEGLDADDVDDDDDDDDDGYDTETEEEDVEALLSENVESDAKASASAQTVEKLSVEA